MKKLMLAVGLFAVAGSAFAAKPCEELKAEIDALVTIVSEVQNSSTSCSVNCPP